VVNFNHAGNYNGFAALSDPNVQQLYIDAVRFTCGCGNGTLEPGETCDDGNQTNGDGCSSTCAIEPCMPPCADQIACTADVCQFDSATAAFLCVHNPINGQCDDQKTAHQRPLRRPDRLHERRGQRNQCSGW
jgi:cysteine-rich repeat protein